MLDVEIRFATDLHIKIDSDKPWVEVETILHKLNNSNKSNRGIDLMGQLLSQQRN